MDKIIRIWIRDEQPGSYFRELRKKVFDADPGSGMEKFESGIRDGKIRIQDGKNSVPGCGINIPDPLH
jgi:hypothetical protein